MLAQPRLDYQPVAGWPQVPSEITLAACMGVDVDAAGNIWLYNRGSHPVIQLDPSGRVLQAWAAHKTVPRHPLAAHGLRIGSDGGVWLVDREINQISKFTPEGVTLLVLGMFAGQAGDNNAKYGFNRPATLNFDSDGNVYVADGYGNTRVAKYSAGGRYIRHWGTPGKGDGQFNLVHEIAVDDVNRIYVGDRGNSRIQVFDRDGKFLAKWEGIGAPWGLDYDAREKVIWMCDGDTGRVTKLSLDGKVLGVFGSKGAGPGQFDAAHAIAAGPDGSLYVAETVNNRLQKLVKK